VAQPAPRREARFWRPATPHTGITCPATGRRKLSCIANPRTPAPKKQVAANNNATDCSHQRLDDCIDWIHCGFPESYRTVRERQSADRMDGRLQSQTADRVESQATNRVTTVRSCLNAIQRIWTMDSRRAASTGIAAIVDLAYSSRGKDAASSNTSNRRAPCAFAIVIHCV